MASPFEQPELVLISLATTLFLYYLIDRMGRKQSEFTNWPLVGMLPGLISNLDRVHDKLTKILCERDGTSWFRGVWFSNTDFLWTSHPDDIQHIFTKNFTNYPKGPDFMEKWETLGGAILGVDSALWKLMRGIFVSIVNDGNFYNTMDIGVWKKMESGMIPVMDHFCETCDEFDLEDGFQRFTFDIACHLTMNQDPGSLSIGLPIVPCQKAFGNVLPVINKRYILPRGIWKMQKWLKIGSEKKFIDSSNDFDNFAYSYLSQCGEHGDRKDVFNILPIMTKAYQENTALISKDLNQFLRDALIEIIFAISDTMSTTLTWLFWLLERNPSAKSRILQEMERELGIKQGDSSTWRTFTTAESRKLVYLHGALSESLRLFPPVPAQLRCPIKEYTLPSGHNVHPNTKIFILFYSVGRMEKYSGSDCLEFKPERWITSHGTIKSVPAYIFLAFNVGPRSCPGKEVAFSIMKMVVATLIYHYDIHAVEGQQVKPKASIILHLKHGLKVTVSKTEESC